MLFCLEDVKMHECCVCYDVQTEATMNICNGCGGWVCNCCSDYTDDGDLYCIDCLEDIKNEVE